MDTRFKHTNRPGFLLGFIDFFTAGLFFLVYMPAGGLQKELEEILGHEVRPYWQAYLLGIPTLFIYTAASIRPGSAGCVKQIRLRSFATGNGSSEQ